jgi:hypothetical protein
MVSFDGSRLALASKVTFKGAEPFFGFVEEFAFTVKCVFILVNICDNGL